MADVRGARILLVDDNRVILEEASEYLTRRGYLVVAVASGDQALAALAADPNFDLLFTDVIMPGRFSGGALAERAMTLRPGLKVLLTSGASEDGGEARDGDRQFIAKPYRMRELAEKIDAMLKASI